MSALETRIQNALKAAVLCGRLKTNDFCCVWPESKQDILALPGISIKGVEFIERMFAEHGGGFSPFVSFEIKEAIRFLEDCGYKVIPPNPNQG